MADLGETGYLIIKTAVFISLNEHMVCLVEGNTGRVK